MLEYRFTWQASSFYDDPEEDLDTELEEYWEGETLNDVLNEASDYWDWNDEAVVNFSAVSELTETSREIVKIEKKNPITKKWVELDTNEYNSVCEQYYKLEDEKMNQ